MSNFSAPPKRKWILIVSIVISLFGPVSLTKPARAQSADGAKPLAGTETSAPRAVVSPDPSLTSQADLPDAPAPAFPAADPAAGESTSLPPGIDFMSGTVPPSGTESSPDAMSFTGGGIAPNSPGYVRLSQCPYDATRARECRVHWRHLIITTSLFNAFQNAGNLYTGFWYRYETTTGKWFDRWINSAADWSWTRWTDGNGFMDDYVGHSMMGAITNSLWIQDDPKGMTVEFGNTPEYWRSRTRAFIFSTAYSFEWKLGPFGEAGIGHNGDHIIPEVHTPSTNETGWVDLVTTPVGGLLWTMTEDALDKHVVRKLEERPRRPLALVAISFLTPARATANIFRWRPPWYRDGRQVKANSFFSEPPGPDDVAGDSQPSSTEEAVSSGGGAGAGVSRGVQSKTEILPLWPHYGGVHEFGAWWGLSLMTGHVWGAAKDIKYMPVDVTYSYSLHRSERIDFRYAPELTALAMLSEPQAGQKSLQLQRKRTYGSGLSPVGFRASFYPESRVQPFLSTDGGFIYFGDRVLSPQGSQFMYTIDFGAGLMIYRKQRQAVTIGYRYQHLSNANISYHNPGTDTNVFYVAVSRFRTKGYR
jgi:hypothetical protein